MKIILFQPRFHESVLSGQKDQTIRPPRKHPIMPGQMASLRGWTGKPYRSPQFVLLNVVITFVAPITIGFSPTNGHYIEVNFTRLTPPLVNELSRHDGFASPDELFGWFAANHGIPPFHGTLIRWRRARSETTDPESDTETRLPSNCVGRQKLPT